MHGVFVEVGDSLLELVLSIHQVGSGHQTQVVELGHRHFHPPTALIYILIYEKGERTQSLLICSPWISSVTLSAYVRLAGRVSLICFYPSGELGKQQPGPAIICCSALGSKPQSEWPPRSYHPVFTKPTLTKCSSGFKICLQRSEQVNNANASEHGARVRKQ